MQATTIDFRLTVNDRDAIELSVDDDGIGMDRDTLENILLCMGGSKKPEGSIGGFGYAKASREIPAPDSIHSNGCYPKTLHLSRIAADELGGNQSITPSSQTQESAKLSNTFIVLCVISGEC